MLALSAFIDTLRLAAMLPAALAQAESLVAVQPQNSQALLTAALIHEQLGNFDLINNRVPAANLTARVDVKVGEVYARCELPKPHGLCSDKWAVDLRLRELTRALDFARVSSEGRFERFCASGASPNG